MREEISAKYTRNANAGVNMMVGVSNTTLLPQ